MVPDQKNKYETDELFKKLSQDVDVSPLYFLSKAPLNVVHVHIPYTVLPMVVAAHGPNLGEVHWLPRPTNGGEEEEVHGGPAGGTLRHCEH